MQITLDESICQRHNLSIEETMLMYMFSKGKDVHQLMSQLVEKDLAGRNLFNEGELVLSSEQKNMVDTILLDSSKLIRPQLDRFDSLALDLINIYKSYGFKGKRPGTNYAWCDSPAVISKKLKVAWNKQQFTDEQAIRALHEYVQSFNGDYTYTELLKYFILKTVTKDGEIKSSLLTTISNFGEESDFQPDWTGRVC